MTKNAEFYYFTLADDLPRKDKLRWFDTTKFKDIPFERIHPDQKGNWLNLTDNDFESLLPVCDKEVKLNKSQQAIFRLFSTGVLTSRDEWMYDFNVNSLKNKIKNLIHFYNDDLDKYKTTGDLSLTQEQSNFSWSDSIRGGIKSLKNRKFNNENLKKVLYRPFTLKTNYFDDILCNTLALQSVYFPLPDSDNKIIWITMHDQVPFSVSASKYIIDHGIGSRISQCFPFHVYDETGKPQENITNWALNQFKNRYACELTKTDIFHYVYAVLHHPVYREKYEQNLKREFPRVPFYDDFSQWVEWGKTLMALHLNYETVEPYPLKRVDSNTSKLPKAKLKADKINGVIELDENTSLSGIPVEAWDYKLGNRSALEWILDQYKEKKPKDATIAEKFNVYRFADYKESVIDLLMRVCRVSVETVGIVEKMR